MTTAIANHIAIPRPVLPHRQAGMGGITNAQNRSMMRARFDSQFTTDQNRRHWQMADAMSVDSSASPMVRRTLRMRNRYEFHNNSFYMGIAETLADYVIGTGPRLTLPQLDKPTAAVVIAAWNAWAAEVGLGGNLWLQRVARTYNGEAFTLMRTNPTLENPVKLDLHQVEADQVTSPTLGLMPAQYPDQFFDGVVLNRWGRPETYHVLRQHPGSFGAFMLLGTEFDPWPARYVLHDFKRIRPGQQRGIPEFTPALPLFAQLRRYTMAVLGAAESIAELNTVMESPVPPNDDGLPAIDSTGADAGTLDAFPLERNMMNVLPPGAKLAQIKAEQPTTTFDMFTIGILREIGRIAHLPLAFTTLDATQANMSSMYVVVQPMVKRIEAERTHYYNPQLCRTFAEFLAEARRVPGLLPDDLPENVVAHWMWPNIGNHADPNKVAASRSTNLSSGLANIPREYAKEGLDWATEQEAAAEALGMTVEEYRAALRAKLFAVPTGNAVGTANPNDPADEETDSEDTDDADDTAPDSVDD